MAIEIERKFLVDTEKLVLNEPGSEYIQGYISSSHGKTVRIRIAGKKGYITIKGKSGFSGMSRYEWEKEIPLSEAEELLLLCEPGIISKTRYRITFGGNIFEVDLFHGENEGLVIAEIELKSEDQPFEKPEWLLNEVTGDKKYYNSHLARTPFTRWQQIS